MSKQWSAYKSHNVLLARIDDPCNLFEEFIDALSEIDRLKARWPNGSRSLYCEQGWLKGIKSRSLDVDAENDLGIR